MGGASIFLLLFQVGSNARLLIVIHDLIIANHILAALMPIMASPQGMGYEKRHHSAGAGLSFRCLPGKNNTAQKIKLASTAITANSA